MKLDKSGNNKINDRAKIKRECLLCDTSFIANHGPASFDSRQPAWEASTLPLSYTRNWLYIIKPESISVKVYV